MTSCLFRIQYADGRVEERSLLDGKFRIGRDGGDVILRDPNASASHGELEIHCGNVVYTDLGSSNGSFDARDRRLTGPTPLSPGHSVQMGRSAITFLGSRPNGSAATLGVAPAARVSAARASVPAGMATPAPATAFAALAPASAGQAAVAVGVAPAFDPVASAFGVAAPAFGAPQAAASAARMASPVPASSVGAPDAASWQGRARGAASALLGRVLPPLGDGERAAGSGAHSHPESAVRHSYPLAITAAGLGEAFRLLSKTTPFVLVRLAVLGGMTVAAVVWWALLVGGFAFFARATPLLAWAWAVVLCVIAGSIWRFVARYVLYLLKAAHIAVLTELITTGGIANGEQSMFQYGRRIVTERFGEVNVLFGLDMLIDGIVSAFNRTLDWVANLLPIPGLDSVMSVVRSVLKASTTYIDETIFSYNLARGDENAFRSSRDGLIYYAQNAQAILKTGLWVVIADRVFTAVIWFVMLGPAFALAYVMPGAASLAAIIIASLFAADVRSAVLRPLFLTMVMVKFHSLVQGQSIDLGWDQRLTAASSKFSELEQKARAWARPSPAPQPAPRAQLA